MEPPQTSNPRVSGIPRPSGIPKPASRLPVLRPAPSSDQLSKKPSVSTLSRPSSSLQKKPPLTRPHASTHSSTGSTAPSRTTLTSTTSRTAPRQTLRASSVQAPFPKQPAGRPPSRQRRIASHPSTTSHTSEAEEDGLGALASFSSSRASSRAGFREMEPDASPESGSPVEPTTPGTPRIGLSLADRTIQSLSSVAASPAGPKSRRTSNFFNPEGSMLPPRHPGSVIGDARPRSSDGTPRAPVTPSRLGTAGLSGAMTLPGKRSVSANTESTGQLTPSKTPLTVRPLPGFRKAPPAHAENARPVPAESGAKTATGARPPRTPSSGGTLSPTGSAQPPFRTGSPDTARKGSNSSAAFREQIAKAKAAPAPAADDAPPKRAASSSSALREQIAKARESARRAKQGGTAPPRRMSGVTENDFGIQPDPAEIAQFDFGLDDPFNQRPKGSKSLLKKRIDAARSDGRLNIAAMGLTEFPEEVLTMYRYDPDNSSVAWGEVVDMATIIAADNELEVLPEGMFPDVDFETFIDSDEDGPQFAGVQTIDLHGNSLKQIPRGLRRMPQLSKLNLSRNKLSLEALDVICEIMTLRELRLAENALQGAIPSTLGALSQLETLELQGNQLISLPTEIGELVRLRSLNVSNNRLTELPSELFTAITLTELIANKNCFRGHFFTVDAAPHLQYLQLSNNEISSLSSTAALALPALKSLDISTNRLTSLPDISGWTTLTTLLAAENKFTSLPEGFTTLKQLRTADFTSNDIKTLDDNIALMEGLESLTVSANPLRERKFLTMNTEDLKRDLLSRLDPGVVQSAQADDWEDLGGTTEAAPSQHAWKLPPSGTLDLSFQNLSEFDEETLLSFPGINDIRTLNLQSNYLTTIPTCLSHIPHLTVLDLSKNNITTPLTQPLALPKLRELRLLRNKLPSLEALTAQLSAPNLQILNISNTSLTGPLPSLRHTFPSLITLYASDNSITSVSASALEGLQIVDLRNNSIGKLDPEIGLLGEKGLKGFEVEGNTFRVPNYAVLRKGTAAVLGWLRDRVPSAVEGFDV
ncbi:L domain-like protein [Sporormia fimetaria CBS 119925]|uniref:L domain-like protein n=1 Tax=Sporormia fimetaria CBS 119925 TaxID=1340428 RepID=A0A6A6V9H9_9PLEO|nr:L domain-like protein [Sporormia fimetaria CBS 119925]